MRHHLNGTYSPIKTIESCQIGDIPHQDCLFAYGRRLVSAGALRGRADPFDVSINFKLIEIVLNRVTACDMIGCDEFPRLCNREATRSAFQVQGHPRLRHQPFLVR